MTAVAEERRVCWLLVMCLALPSGHPARVRYVPPLAATLAERARRTTGRN